METERKNLMKELIIGVLAVVIILIIGTFWMGKSVNKDNDEAVRTVSLLYLDELAGRREQVIASKLNDYINNMDIALGLITPNDLSSIENFQAYQSRMKQLYGFGKFAFVDTEGKIYTSRGTRNDVDKYGIDYNNLSDTQIIIKNLEGNTKKVIIAMPVDNLSFIGKTLVVCFMEMDMNRMLESVSLQTTGNNSTFCNLYTKDGIALTNVVLGGLANENNLLAAMAAAEFDETYSLEKITEDFKSGKKGFVAFNYGGIQETLYYVPVHGTDWMLTYLIRESVISEQIGSITDGIIFRSLIHSTITAIALVSMFVLVIVQLRKAAKSRLEKETADAENRVKQQELEEQLALQEELLAQEQHKTQQDNMIKVLASDYRSVYYINLFEDDGVCYRSDDTIAEGEHFSFSEKFTEYADTYITEEYRADFLNFIKPESIREGLKNDLSLIYRYTVNRNDVESYEMIRIVGVKSKDGGNYIQFIGVGFADIDAEMRDSATRSKLPKRQAKQRQLSFRQ